MRISYLLGSKSKLINSGLIKSFCSRMTTNSNSCENASELAHIEFIHGPIRRNPVLLLHPILSSSSVWKNVGSDIAKRIQAKVIAPDLRNHGCSSWSLSQTYAEMVQDLERFLEEKDIQWCDLIGHSFGGRLAMLFSLLHPERVNSLTVIDISPFSLPANHLHGFPKFLNKLQDLLASLPTGISLYEARTLVANQLRDKLNNEKLAKLMADSVVEKPEGGYMWEFNIRGIEDAMTSGGIDYRLPPGLQFHFPTLFIRSQFLKAEDLDKIRTVFPSSEMVHIPGDSHWPMLDKPKEFVDIVSDFVSQH